MTKDLLINFLFILLSLCLVQMVYLVKYVYRLEEIKGWVIGIFPIVSLILCMLLPVALEKSFIWDLRWIPFILGSLIGGFRLGFSQLLLVLIIRYLQGNDVGFYVTAITHIYIGLLAIFLSKYYLNMNIKQKLTLSFALTLFALSSSAIVSIHIFHVKIDSIFWTKYVVIHIIGMFISTLLWEVIQTNFQVLQKLVKAEKLQIVSHLAASISHEVRNPLTVSRGFIQMLSEGEATQARKEYATIALQELDRATEVINDYLTFAKPAFDIEENININEEVQHAVNVIIPLANMNGIQVKLSLVEHHHYLAKGDKKKFQQCLINIMKNGIESMENHGEINIHLDYKDTTLHINIQDEGAGMTQEQINRLGEPYFTTKEKGTGLGMMVSYSIIKGMNGHIHVTSEHGKGTCFSIILPVQAYKKKLISNTLSLT
ncbi:ATP-binding protein [Peribacillus huizhouensis]|uniref:histidine kinase n=1 Tax=Peribacillus huizhouensis TaxID=1501239 RepID=A0ABR6CV36_9BACI|nr:ATP-binding protein [Peribacillus huizhouensis]MBA9028470.1 two-component system sporulation sensor kinase B [Peribacillus huizhouensis]